MKIVSAQTMQELDRRTINERNIPGLLLMENAGKGCAEVIMAHYGGLEPRRAVIAAGKGNNGGDGYVIARLLQEQGWWVKTIIFAAPGDITGDAAVNLARLDPSSIHYCCVSEDLERTAGDFRAASVIVDAIFGTGLKNEVRGLFAAAVGMINVAGRPICSVDIPSGIDATTGDVLGVAVKADITVTFCLAKIGQVLYPGAEYTGRLKVIDIGIPPEFATSAPGVDFIDADAAHSLLLKRKRAAHKGDYGHCLILAGSTGKTGAAALAANSAVRTGSGLVTLAVPASLNAILEVKTTEAMTVPLPDGGKGFWGNDALPQLENTIAGKDAVAIGPGISLNRETGEAVRALLTEISQPLVVDADGISALSADVTILTAKKSAALILTPHPGEMARLLKSTTADVEKDRIRTASSFAVQHGVYLILKGARTVVAAPTGEVALNGSGNPGMASGGMGDVLTGMLVSLLGQKYEPMNACKLAVFLHGFAADMVAEHKGEAGMSAVDVQECIPFAIKKLAELY